MIEEPRVPLFSSSAPDGEDVQSGADWDFVGYEDWLDRLADDLGYPEWEDLNDDTA